MATTAETMEALRQSIAADKARAAQAAANARNIAERVSRG